MTTYTAISNITAEKDKPATQALIRSLRDNPLAIAEGDATAPSVSSKALAVEAGDVLTYGDYSTQTVSSTSYVKIKGVSLPFKGSYRAVFEATGSGTVYLRLYLNGVAVGTEVAGGGGASGTQDVTGIASGDVLELWGRSSAGSVSATKLELKVASGAGFVKTT